MAPFRILPRGLTDESVFITRWETRGRRSRLIVDSFSFRTSDRWSAGSSSEGARCWLRQTLGEFALILGCGVHYRDVPRLSPAIRDKSKPRFLISGRSLVSSLVFQRIGISRRMAAPLSWLRKPYQALFGLILNQSLIPAPIKASEAYRPGQVRPILPPAQPGPISVCAAQRLTAALLDSIE